MEGCAVLIIFNFAHGAIDLPWPQSEERPITLFASTYVSMSFSQMRHCMNVCLYLFMYVICIYIRTKELKCFLVQMLLTSHHRKISDSKPMIGLNGPKKLDAV